MPKAPKNWWRTFFDPKSYTPAEKQRLAWAPLEAAFIVKALGLKRGSEVLDLCCGPGRHSVLLAAKGLKVTGFDWSGPYLRQARERARRLGVQARFVQGDMRRLPFRSEFDAVVNLFTSFGYFHRQSENLQALKEARKALRPGGLFLIDVLNQAWLVRHFTPRDWAPSAGGYVLEEHRLLDGGRRVVTSWIRVYPDGKTDERSLALHNYDKKSLAGLLRRAGLEVLRYWGGFTGEPLRAGSRRLIVLAQKPGRSRI